MPSSIYILLTTLIICSIPSCKKHKNTVDVSKTTNDQSIKITSDIVLKLNGEFVADPERCMEWLLNNKNSILFVDGKIIQERVESFRRNISTEPLLVHRWTKNGFEVIAGNGFDHKSKHPWIKVDESTYTMTVPKKPNSSNDVNYLLGIIDKDSYYFEVSGNGNKIREFYVRKTTKKTENKSQ
tara:strand:+ start:60 stop:608 length:549 start_codon:yes stop_codon:yes gene_type:complete